MKDKNFRRLEYMLKVLDRMTGYCENETLETFLSDQKTLDACVANIIALGEEAKHVEPGYQKLYPEIAWKAISGMRNRLAHDYFNVDYKILWSVIQNDLPLLKSQITGILTSGQ